MKHRSPAGLAAVLAALACAPAAAAAPATVTVRVEGAERTIYENVVRTDAKHISMGSGPNWGGTTYPGGTHPCTGTNGGANPSPGATPNTALDDAARLGGFSWYGPYDSSYEDFFVATIAAEGTLDGPYWEGRVNHAVNAAGGCQILVRDGDEVLFAYDAFDKPGLKLTGPRVARPGQSFAVTVTDGGTGAPVPGATVGTRTTGADGRATVAYDGTGPRRLKAAKPGTVRSNALDVCVTTGSDGACGSSRPLPPAPPCVTDGSDGRCGSPDRQPPVGRIAGIEEKQRFKRRDAPRELHGFVDAEPSGLRAVKLRLTRQKGRKCWLYSGRRERFLRRGCGKRYAFKIGEDATWSYLLPHQLRRGRYVLDVIAVDGAGNRDTLARGRSRVVFRVR